jgi:hypothetical protein
VRSSCGCTTPQIGQPWLKTWQKSEIKAVVDTRGHLGRKDATLTVIFDRPFPAEVQLNCYTFIRGDVVVQPEVVQFGAVAQGTAVQRKAQISYAGRSDWRIERVESGNPHLSAQVVERERGGGSVKYDLLVTLAAGAPSGRIQEHLVLVTNDYAASSARVPVPVEGAVEGAGGVTVRPSPLMMGLAEPGKTVTRQLVVQGRAPFRILAARADDQRFRVGASPEAKSVHIVPVTFTAGSDPGNIATKLHLQTDQATTKEVDVVAQVQVVRQ